MGTKSRETIYGASVRAAAERATEAKFAIVEGERREAQPGLSAECPACDDAMIAKCGEHRVWHWAHRGAHTCEPWWEPETEWHRDWKNHFPEGWQEIIHRSKDDAIACKRRSRVRPARLVLDQHGKRSKPYRNSSICRAAKGLRCSGVCQRPGPGSSGPRILMSPRRSEQRRPSVGVDG